MSEPKDSKSQPVHEDTYLKPYSFFDEDTLKLIEEMDELRWQQVDELCRKMVQAARNNVWKVDPNIQNAWEIEKTDRNHWDAWRAPDA